MPNYFVTNTARFNPFSYAELAAPIMQATEAQYALEDTLSTIDDGTLESYLAGESSDSPYKVKYDSLNSRIKAASEQLATNGISPSLIREAKAIRGDYKKFATPVEAGAKRRAQILSDYDRLARSGYMIGENPHDKDLQYFIENPDYAPQYMDGKGLLSIGAVLGQSLAEQFDPQYSLSPDGKYYNIQTRRTATLDDIRNKEEFKTAIDSALEAQGFDPKASDSITKQARQAIEFGLYNNMQDKGMKIQAVPRYVGSGSGRSTKRNSKLPAGAIELGSGRNAKRVQNGGIVEIVQDEDGNWKQIEADQELIDEYNKFQEKSNTNSKNGKGPEHNNVSSRVSISSSNVASTDPYFTEDDAKEKLYNGNEEEGLVGIKDASKVQKLSSEFAKERMGNKYNPNLIYIAIDDNLFAVTPNTLRNIYSKGFSEASSIRNDNKRERKIQEYNNKFVGFNPEDLREPK